MIQNRHNMLLCSTVNKELHRDRKKTPPPPKQNAVKCTVYNTIQ